MVDVNASKNPKGTNTKKDKEDRMPKTPFFSKMRRITDTNVGTINMIQVKDRLKEGQSPMAKKIYKNKIGYTKAGRESPDHQGSLCQTSNQNMAISLCFSARSWA